MTDKLNNNECDCECFDCSEDGGFNHCQDEDCYITEEDNGN